MPGSAAMAAAIDQPGVVPLQPFDGRLSLSCDHLPRLVHSARTEQGRILSAHFDSADDHLHVAVRERFLALAEAKDATPESIAPKLPVVVGFQLLKVGHFVYPGVFEDEEFDIDEAYVSKMVRNFEREQRAGHEPFVTYGHPWDLGSTPADAWIVELEARPRGLFGSIKLLAPTADNIAEDRFRYFSSTFHDNWRDEGGKERGPTILSGAITNFPFLRGMQQYQLAAFSARLSSAGSPMAKTKTAEEATAVVPETPAPTAVAALESPEQKEIRELKAQLAEEKASRATAERDADALELSLSSMGREAATRATGGEADTIRALVRAAEGADGGPCRLPPAMRDQLLPGFSADPVKALAGSPVFRGSTRALRGYLAALPPVVEVGKQRASAGGAGLSAGAGGVALDAGDAIADPNVPRVVDGVVVMSDEQAKARGFAGAAHFAACLDKSRTRQAAWSGRPEFGPDGATKPTAMGTTFLG